MPDRREGAPYLSHVPDHRRPPLDPELVREELAARAVPWRDVRVVGATGSTNRDAADLARQDAATGTAVLADEQTQGRGRLQRGWVSPPGASLSLSVVLRPSAPDERWGWLPLLTGVAVLQGVRDALAGLGRDGSSLGLKWPNDLVVDGPDRGGGPGPRKWGGILAERIDGARGAAAVVGIGLNVALDADELPTSTATSLALEVAGAVPRREVLAAAVLSRAASWFGLWDGSRGDAVGCGLLTAYRASCLTLGRDVRVELPGGAERGRATGIDASGRLLVAGAGGQRAYSSGEVVHLRPS